MKIGQGFGSYRWSQICCAGLYVNCFCSGPCHSADLASAAPYRRRGKPPVCMTSAEGNEIISLTLLSLADTVS